MGLDDLFDPAGIAVIGASETPGKLGHDAMANAVAFDGPVYPVNPSSEGTLFGERFVGSVGEIDGPVDLALLCIPAPVVPEVLEESGKAGVGAAVVYSGGFAEAGDDGRQRQSRVEALANRYDIAVLGPNTSGFLVPGRTLVCSFVGEVERVESGTVAVIAQSGGVAHALAFQAQSEGYGIAAMVGLGNRVSVGFEEAIRYFDGHPPTDAIALHVEGTTDARGLLETCRAVETPVVAYTVGRTGVDGFAASHTGALTGDWALYRAGFKQYGVPTVPATTTLLDSARTLGSQPRPAGPNVGVVTVQAGPGIIIADRLNAAGVPVPEFDAATADRLSEYLDGLTYAANPVDTGRPSPAFGDVIETVARDSGIDILLVYQLYEPSVGYPTSALESVAEQFDMPVILATDGPEPGVSDAIAPLEAAGVTTVRTPERGADAVIALVEYVRRQRRLQEAQPDG